VTRMMNLNRHLEVARRKMTNDNYGYLYVHACTLLHTCYVSFFNGMFSAQNGGGAFLNRARAVPVNSKGCVWVVNAACNQFS